tara:strand:+ start:2255 stop:3244 length:990 start_codon:yes stop_codon:yes gene_type:complete
MNQITVSYLKKFITPCQHNHTIDNINKLYEQRIVDNMNHCHSLSSLSNNNHSIKDFYTTLIQGSENKTLVSTEKKPKKSITKHVVYRKTDTNTVTPISSVLSLLHLNSLSNVNITFDKYSIYGSELRDSYFDSILLSLDETYRNYKQIIPIVKSQANLSKRKKELIDAILLFLQNHSDIRQIYKNYHIKIKDIKTKLYNDENIDLHGDIKVVFADYFDVSIMIINMEQNNYRYINNYNKNTKHTIILLENNSQYEPIIHIDEAFIQLIKDNIPLKNKKHVTLLPINKYKVVELQALASSLQISIMNETNTKKKLKKQLYDDIVHYIKDL